MVNLHNIIEKVKHSVLENFRHYFNKLLKKHNTGRSLCKIYKGKKREKMNYNKILIYKKLKDIFSAKISPKYKHYSKDNNIKLIKEILNDKDENKNTLKQISIFLKYVLLYYHLWIYHVSLCLWNVLFFYPFSHFFLFLLFYFLNFYSMI